MNFADEPYVRLYTRKTLTSKLLGWEGRMVLRMMIDEFDQSGVFEFRGDAATCISAVTDVPVDLARAGLQRLVDTETWIVTARAITWPSYDEAQHCQRSDRIRQQESRRARAALASREPAVTDVTPPPSPVTDVTNGHSSFPPPFTPIQSERGARTPEKPLPEVPGLSVVAAKPYPGPLGPSKRERELTARADALSEHGPPRHEFAPGWAPGKSNQARGHELGLTDDEIHDRWEICKDKHYPSAFRSDAKQFNRELAFAAQDKKTHGFKSARERAAFENPGRERRAT